jgi:hypothetical protein
MYMPSENDARKLENNFTYHPPKDGQVERYKEIRQLAHGFAKSLVHLCPSSRELSLALTHIEECVMWANASIARNEQE